MDMHWVIRNRQTDHLLFVEMMTVVLDVHLGSGIFPGNTPGQYRDMASTPTFTFLK